MSHPPTASVAVVTDSSADLSAELVGDLEIAVVPLRVVIGGVQYLEGEEIGAEDVTEAMRTKVAVTTSRPSPQAFLATYARLVDAGFDAVVSVHLSAEVSGTYDSAVLAAAESPAPVEVVDTRTLALGLGFAVRAAARTAATGGSVVEVAAAARDVAAASRSLFYVDTLEYLRRGGRIGAAAALLGSALAVKPLLVVTEGRIGPLEKVRTTGRALNRIEELAAEAAAASSTPVEVAVQHLASAERADAVAGRLKERLELQQVYVSEVGAVIGAHVGPGMLAVVVAPRSA